MSVYIFIFVALLQLTAGYGQVQSQGSGAFSYSDSSGRRYGGVYGLKDGKVVNAEGTFPPDFKPPTFEEPNFQDLDYNIGEFFPEYFKNLETILEDARTPYVPPTPFFPSTPFMRPGLGFPTPTPFSAFGGYNPYSINPLFSVPTLPPYNFNSVFKNSIDNQKLAFDSARKAFDMTSNQGAFHGNQGFQNNGFNGPNVDRFSDFSGFGFRGGNSAFASGAIGPGFQEQIAAINPENPSNPNVKVSRFSAPSNSGYKSVSVSSFSSSADINGQKTSSRKASTIIDDNGKITRYDVSS